MKQVIMLMLPLIIGILGSCKSKGPGGACSELNLYNKTAYPFHMVYYRNGQSTESVSVGNDLFLIENYSVGTCIGPPEYETILGADSVTFEFSEGQILKFKKEDYSSANPLFAQNYITDEQIIEGGFSYYTTSWSLEEDMIPQKN